MDHRPFLCWLSGRYSLHGHKFRGGGGRPPGLGGFFKRKTKKEPNGNYKNRQVWGLLFFSPCALDCPKATISYRLHRLDNLCVGNSVGSAHVLDLLLASGQQIRSIGWIGHWGRHSIFASLPGSLCGPCLHQSLTLGDASRASCLYPELDCLCPGHLPYSSPLQRDSREVSRISKEEISFCERDRSV